MKVVIIGSGMAGLTAGAYLAKAGHEVTVFEQFPTPGGVTATVTQDGYGWDIGPLLLEGFAPGDKGRLILEELGVSEKVPVVHEDRGLSMPEFTLWRPEEYEGPYWRRERLKQIFPEESAALDRYYRFYDQMIKLMSLARRAETARGLPALWLKLRMLLAFQPVKGKVSWSGGQLMDHYFQLAGAEDLLPGHRGGLRHRAERVPRLGRPVHPPGDGVRQAHPHLPGHTKRPDRLYLHPGRLPDAGGCGHGRDPGTGWKSADEHARSRSIVIENGRAVGVKLADGRIEHADLVLASGGMKEVFFDLVGREHLPEELIQQIEANRLMESVLMVQLGIDFDPTPWQPAALCYYYKTDDLEGAVQRLRSGDYHEGKEGFLIYVPSLHSPSLAPAGKYAVTIYTVAPDTLAEGTWSEPQGGTGGQTGGGGGSPHPGAARAYANPPDPDPGRFPPAHPPETPLVRRGAAGDGQQAAGPQDTDRRACGSSVRRARAPAGC